MRNIWHPLLSQVKVTVVEKKGIEKKELSETFR